MRSTLFINGKDAYLTWGITMDQSSLSALMTPPPLKAFVENNSRLEHGKQVITNNPKLDARGLNLVINLTARNEEAFFQRYESFCKELATGILHIRTKYQPQTIYHTIYLSCTQFSQFMRGIAKFTLKLNEPDPSNRTDWV